MKFLSKPVLGGLLVGGGLGFLVAAVAMKRSQFEALQEGQRLEAQSDSLKETTRKLESMARSLDHLVGRLNADPSKQASSFENKTASIPRETQDGGEAVPVSEFNALRDLSKAELEQLSNRIQDDRVRRYEESLDEAGREELEKRFQIHIEQFSTGTLPGWEDQKITIPDDGKYRESMLARIRRTVLIEMYLEHEFENDMQISGEERFILEEN